MTIVGQKFTEADILTQLYKQLLDKEGFETEVKNLAHVTSTSSHWRRVTCRSLPTTSPR